MRSARQEDDEIPGTGTVLEDEHRITASDLRWLRQTRQVIDQEMLDHLKRNRERGTALQVFIWLAGGLVAVFGLDKLTKWGIKILELLGSSK